MASIAPLVLGAETYQRKWRVDINDTGSGGTYAAPIWIPFSGIKSLNYSDNPELGENSDYASGGRKSQTLRALGNTVEITCRRAKDGSTPTIYNPAQELARIAAGTIGATIDARCYEVNSGGPNVIAWRSNYVVTWEPAGGEQHEPDEVAVTLTEAGLYTAITHPDAAGAVPVLYSVTPAVGVQAGGTLHRLVGNGFFAAGVAAVESMKLGVTSVPTFFAENDNVLYFLAPAKAAGSFVVYVTNGTGESTTATVTLTIT
jgi:hypothetical protein